MAAFAFVEAELAGFVVVLDAAAVLEPAVPAFLAVAPAEPVHQHKLLFIGTAHKYDSFGT